MDIDDVAACLTLLGLPDAGGAGVLRVLRSVAAPREALRLAPGELQILGIAADLAQAISALRGQTDPRALDRARQLQAEGTRVLFLHEAGYPRQLAAISRAPPVLFVQGDVDGLAGPHMAVVGSRKPTPAGREFAAELAAGLGAYGLGIVSGLALGIDTAAHQGALRGAARTVAVLGSALDRVYPTRNASLARQIVAEGGTVLSEFPPGTGPDARHFPRRNRIVSGLSLGVVVVEAGLPSGSLLTAQHAAEQGREVMAVPGAVRSPVSKGCHELLRNGAALVECAEDVVRALGDRFAAPVARRTAPGPDATDPYPALEDAERRVMEALGFEEVDADTLIVRTGLTAAEANVLLVALELRGLVTRTARGFSRV